MKTLGSFNADPSFLDHRRSGYVKSFVGFANPQLSLNLDKVFLKLLMLNPLKNSCSKHY